MPKQKDNETDRITIPIMKTDDIYAPVENLSEKEERSFTAQIRVLVREALTARGILKPKAGAAK